MRFMMILYPGPPGEAGGAPAPALLEKRRSYDAQLVASGVLLAGEGLHGTSRGARVRFEAGRPRVEEGPFSGEKEPIGGFWMIEVRSKEEALEWAKRAPCPDGEMIEIRQVRAPARVGPGDDALPEPGAGQTEAKAQE